MDNEAREVYRGVSDQLMLMEKVIRKCSTIFLPKKKAYNTIFQHSRAFRNFSSCSKLGNFSSSPKRSNSGPKSHSCPWVTYPRYFVIHWDAGYLPFVSSDPLFALLLSLCPRNLTCMDSSVGPLGHCGSLVGDPKWGQGCMRSAPFWLGFIF